MRLSTSKYGKPINDGSISKSKIGDPGAVYGIFTGEGHNIKAEFISVTFDLEKTVSAIEVSHMYAIRQIAANG